MNINRNRNRRLNNRRRTYNYTNSPAINAKDADEQLKLLSRQSDNLLNRIKQIKKSVITQKGRFAKPIFTETNARPSYREQEWMEAHPLNEGCIHEQYYRDENGMLWEEFVKISGYTANRIVNSTRRDPSAPGYRKCTTDYCNFWGRRVDLPNKTSRMMFGRKCDCTCTIVQCGRCERVPKVITHKTLATSVCGTCRDDEETTRLATHYIYNGKHVVKTKYIQMKIEEILEKAIGTEATERIS